MTYLKDMPDFQKMNKVLIIKLRHLGDVLLSTACIHVLKKRFPHLMIDILINEEGEALLEDIQEIHKVHVYSRKKSKQGFLKKINVELKLASLIRKQNYDLVINLTEGDKGNFLAFLSRAPLKVGQMGSKGQKFLTHLYKHPLTYRHSVEKDLDALRRLGIYPQEDEKKLLIQETKTKNFEDFLLSHALEDYYVLHPVSRWMYKSPQVHTFIELVNRLDKKVIVTGLDKGLEGDFIKTIIAKCPSAIYYPTLGSLKALVSVIAQSKGIITVDSLPLHIASALKKPTVCLFGPTSEIDWGPWHNQASKVVTYKKSCRSCYKDGCGGGKLSDCLDQIKVDDIIEACRSVFQEVQ